MQCLISICVTKFSMLDLFIFAVFFFFLFELMMAYLEAKVGRVLLLKLILMLLIIKKAYAMFTLLKIRVGNVTYETPGCQSE